MAVNKHKRDRVMIIGALGSGKLTLVDKVFSNNKISNDITAGRADHAGIVHEVELKTKYYTKSLQLWIDEYDETKESESFQVWANDFKSDAFKEIRDVLAGIIFCFDISKINAVNHIEAIKGILDQLKKDMKEDHGNINNEDNNEIMYDDPVIWCGFLLVAGIVKDKRLGSKVDTKAIKEVFWDENIDFVEFNWDDKPDDYSRDLFGDRKGVARIREVFECFDWNEMEQDNDDDNDDDDNEFENLQELRIKEMTKSLNLDEETKEFDIEYIINKMKDAKFTADSMKSQQKKEQFAKEIVQDIMKYL